MDMPTKSPLGREGEFDDTVGIRIGWTDYEARWPKTAKSLKPTL
jgi:hypothetical protein